MILNEKTRDIAFNDILKAMKRSEMDFKIEDYDNDNNLYGYLKKLNVSGWEITRCQNIANYCAEDKKSWNWLCDEKTESNNKIEADSLFIKLEDFFTSKNADKSRYVVARVGCETKSNVENPVFGYWENYHYITIYGYDPNNIFTYKNGYKYNGQPREKEIGFFYVNDHLDSKSTRYGVYGAERLVQQATQLFFFEEK